MGAGLSFDVTRGVTDLVGRAPRNSSSRPCYLPSKPMISEPAHVYYDHPSRRVIHYRQDFAANAEVFEQASLR